MLASYSQKPRVVQAERFDLDVTQRMYFETTSTIPDTFRFGFMSTIADKDFPLDRSIWTLSWRVTVWCTLRML